MNIKGSKKKNQVLSVNKRFNSNGFVTVQGLAGLKKTDGVNW